METGVKLNVTKAIRSSKTGMFLPREGTLVSVTENLGRTLLLVEFEDGQHEYLFEYEVEFENGNASRPTASNVLTRTPPKSTSAKQALLLVKANDMPSQAHS